MTKIGFKCRLIASVLSFAIGIVVTIINIVLLSKLISQKLCDDSYISCFIEMFVQDSFNNILPGFLFLLIGLLVLYIGYIIFPKR